MISKAKSKILAVVCADIGLFFATVLYKFDHKDFEVAELQNHRHDYVPMFCVCVCPRSHGVGFYRALWSQAIMTVCLHGMRVDNNARTMLAFKGI